MTDPYVITNFRRLTRNTYTLATIFQLHMPRPERCKFCIHKGSICPDDDDKAGCRHYINEYLNAEAVCQLMTKSATG